MTDAITILKDHRRHLIQRLVSRSPLLRFLPGAYREDICALFKNITPNTPTQTIRRQNTATTPLSLLQSLLSQAPATILNPVAAAVSKCRKIRVEAEEYRHTTGQHSLFIGYPLIFTPLDTGRFLLAPLFLWPIELKVSATQITFTRPKDKDQEDFLEAQFNRIFKAWLEHEQGIHLKWENEEEEATWENIVSQTRQILSTWRDCQKNFSTQAIDPFPEYLRKKPRTSVRGEDQQLEFPLQMSSEALLSDKKRPMVLSSAIVGHASFKGQALLDDLDKLEQQLQHDPTDCGLLKYFLLPVQRETDRRSPVPRDNEKWLVADSDHSQESAIWQSRQSDLIILQGPPGTGKSQTIVNLIANALAQSKNVLVVCQKRAALEVVKKRLVAANLGELLELIDDPSNDRARVIKAIKNIEVDLDIQPILSKKREELISEFVDIEKQLDNWANLLSDTFQNTRLRYADLRAKLSLLKRNGIRVHDGGELEKLYQKFVREGLQIEGWEELQREYITLQDFLRLYEDCHYDTNHWKYLETEKAPNTSNLQQLTELLETCVNLAFHVDAQPTKYFHPNRVAWLVEHPWSDPHYLGFIPDSYRESQKAFCQLVRRSKTLKAWLSVSYLQQLIQPPVIAQSYQELLQDAASVSMIYEMQQSYNLILCMAI